jgi:glycerophosphoryl diester phosphodiesterase
LRKLIDNKIYLAEIKTIVIIFLLNIGIISCDSEPILPKGGICAHRGASSSHPENTIASFKEAIRLGVHMIEFDVRFSKDSALVIIHDATLDRTTNGRENVNDYFLKELKKLDAGSWKNGKFKGEKIPTLEETLEIMPQNVWLNIHLKNDVKLGSKVAGKIVELNRLHQSILACDKKTAEAAREVNRKIKICNMDRQDSSMRYVKDTIDMNANFIQLKGRANNNLGNITQKLKKHNIKINYYGTNSPETLKMLFNSGVEFPLVDDVEKMIETAAKLGIKPIKPKY